MEYYQRTSRPDLPTYDTRVQSKIHSLANLAAARATCQPAAAARRSQARRGAHPTQNAGVHPRPRLRPAHGRLPARVRGRRAVVEDLGVRPPDGGQAAADDARPRPPARTRCPSGGARRARRSLAPRARSARSSADGTARQYSGLHGCLFRDSSRVAETRRQQRAREELDEQLPCSSLGSSSGLLASGSRRPGHERVATTEHVAAS